MDKPRVLYIDDEDINLVNFKHTLAGEYKIFTVHTGEEALSLLEKEGELAVVVADQRMPGISGIDVLFKVRELYPDTARMVITAFTEVEDMIDAINRGHVFRYIVKPWNEHDLRMSIRNAVENFSLVKRNSSMLAELAEKNKRLATMNTELERQVQTRTQELEGSNSELRRVNTELLSAKVRVEAQAQELEGMNETLRERLAELEEASQNVKALQGLLPICSYCKKIRDDQDYWEELEQYMRRHSEMEFTHCICPDCYERHVKPELTCYRERIKKDSQL